MSEDLVEALARRLHAAYWIESAGHSYELGELDHRDIQLWKAVAAEALRQMEWSKIEAIAWAEQPEIPRGGPGAPLTLAPDDWKP